MEPFPALVRYDQVYAMWKRVGGWGISWLVSYLLPANPPPYTHTHFSTLQYQFFPTNSGIEWSKI